MSQIPLPLEFDRHFSFENFCAPNSDYIIQQISSFFDETGESLIGLYGGADSGKTHLLNACAHYARHREITFNLFDALQLQISDPTHFSEFPLGSVIAIDNIDLLAGSKNWEKQLYQLINRVKMNELRLIFTTSHQPRDVSFKLPDLKSRLMWGLLVSLPNPDDKQVELILIARARLLGLDIGDDVVKYLLTHFSRKLSEQMKLLYQLDHASMTSKRKVTIPLVRETCKS